jgi:hypothetical protein
MSLLNKLGLAVLGAGLLVGTAGCGPVDELFDCQSVCSRYKDCVDSKYDVGACRSRCKDKSEQDQDYRRKADQCEACIKERSCGEATFKCAPECASIVG